MAPPAACGSWHSTHEGCLMGTSSNAIPGTDCHGGEKHAEYIGCLSHGHRTEHKPLMSRFVAMNL